MVIKMNLIDVVNDLIKRNDEEEWFEFKENCFEPIAFGEYVLVLSNSAALTGKEFAYFILGVSTK